MSSFDKNIRKKLDRYESKVSSNMWAKIEVGLPANENPPVRRWWIPVFGVVLIASFFLGLHFYNLNNKEFILNEGGLMADNNNETIRINLSSADIINSENAKESSSAHVNEKVKEESLINRFDSKNEVHSNSTPSKSINVAYKHLALKDSRVNQKESQSAAEKEAKTIKDRGKEARSASLYEQYNSILKATKSNQKGRNIQIIEREVEDVAPVIPMRSTLHYVNSELNNVLSSMSGKRTICPSFKNVRFGLFAEAFYSNDYGLRDLSYNYLGSEFNYLDARNDTEKANYSFSAGARVSFIMPNGIGAKTGFSYSQINEVFKYKDTDHQKTKTVIIKEYVWENNVIVDSMETTTEVLISGELNVVSQNKYKVIDLPFLFTYEWGYKNRFYCSVTCGPLLNLSFRQQGKFLNPETMTPVDFSTEVGNYNAFNTNIGSSLFLSFALNYQLGNGADIFVEPNLRHQLNKTTLNSYELNQKYTILGLGFGIKYKL